MNILQKGRSIVDGIQKYVEGKQGQIARSPIEVLQKGLTDAIQVGNVEMAAMLTRELRELSLTPAYRDRIEAETALLEQLALKEARDIDRQDQTDERAARLEQAELESRQIENARIEAERMAVAANIPGTPEWEAKQRALQDQADARGDACVAGQTERNPGRRRY